MFLRGMSSDEHRIKCMSRGGEAAMKISEWAKP